MLRDQRLGAWAALLSELERNQKQLLRNRMLFLSSDVL